MIKKLGFGFMRLPKIGDNFDINLIIKMVDVFLDNGYTYFDTAYVYNGSEETLRTALVERYPREKYQITTKLPIYKINETNTAQDIFNTSLKRLGVEYIDNYLLHGIDKLWSDFADKYHVWQFINDLKLRGLTKTIGFSFHGAPDDLDDILTKHPEVDLVQLQINYLDWDSDKTQSRRLYELARQHEKPIIIMEPVKGGLLSSSLSPINALLKNAKPNASVASWAVRFAASLEGVVVMLSGMSNMEQMVDNISTINNLEPLTENETDNITQAINILNNIQKVPCTSCNYCVEGCPRNIMIPNLLNLYNDYLVFEDVSSSTLMYKMITEGGNTASVCICCHNCEERCPQHIGIADIMSSISTLFD